ncbi:DUF1003 domain-containing protein [Microbacterium rhizosphaerae]|uniref:DUF1003 domain-containing protein n=1 Tax=Microbacterium rhizosphaerae TaxID=1678237 RepID=A0ABZ0SLX8_9MICO|nr:DUF1003 domain-containing protein [Microbacterium rhizosphaerae]WPR89490.1 DUF1003 domain-containing protein [Microbacterium rhizosphaerae]
MSTTTAPPAKPATKAPRGPYLRPSRLLKNVDPARLHPAVLAQAERRAASVQLRIADGITAFAGSMAFVYLHIVVFAVWMLWIERSPWPTLTLIVSLEAIFLSTFVMIGQNRQAAFQQAKADRDYTDQETLLVENTELTRTIRDLSEQIRDLTTQIHAHVVAPPADQGKDATGPAGRAS